ncbi:MAG TPA: biotin carboxylase N-terminal domain-containing protein, partial [Alphaproteobacteria bacterium]|nr:biotin carboxylase N-terminal domain-containing protein [Alphaproteobacteria bacterium]
MIKSVLIANRGEIACRIIRTARRLGIRTVAVYSEVDEDSLAVQMADEAYPIGPSPASESYLNIPKIIKAAKQAKVEAIHPGYGFLSENEDFAKACCENGFIFMGPPLDALKKMGSKSEAKAIARRANIPVIPGYEGDQNKLPQEADRMGYPLMIKAVMGGGGKGIRQVNSKAEFQSALDTCRREALSSFGCEDVLLEKYISIPRHVEIQIFGDVHGNFVHLFERDCSLQRRHQKVLEEAPSNLSLELKEQLYSAALTLARVIHYEGAGTVEFLVDASGQFYFMEMNTRLQVEHPITEAITGLDLVEWQFRIASKEKLPLSQADIMQQGHSVELRLYAEDPSQNFKPVTGPFWIKEVPEAVRIDSGFHAIDRITSYYDPLLAKLIVRGENRDSALQKARFALENLQILGLKTNVSFLKKLLQNKDVCSNHIDVGYIDHHLKVLAPPKKVPEKVYVAASLIKALLESKNGLSPWDDKYNWRVEGYAPFFFEWMCEGEMKLVSLTYSPKGWIYNGLDPLKTKCSNDTLSFSTLRIPFWKTEEKISLIFQGETYTLT